MSGITIPVFASFNTQPPEGGWAAGIHYCNGALQFQHTAARRRLVQSSAQNRNEVDVSTHSRPKAAGAGTGNTLTALEVSTHSRPKAAGDRHAADLLELTFQHTAARRRLGRALTLSQLFGTVSTHSRPKAAGRKRRKTMPNRSVSTHSRPKAAGQNGLVVYAGFCSFNTQPPEGGWQQMQIFKSAIFLFQHTAARRRLGKRYEWDDRRKWFQHTAARRRLGLVVGFARQKSCFNTQPPEGGWSDFWGWLVFPKRFNTQPPEGGWVYMML